MAPKTSKKTAKATPKKTRKKSLRQGTIPVSLKITQRESDIIKEWDEYFSSGGFEKAMREMIARGYLAAEEATQAAEGGE